MDINHISPLFPSNEMTMGLPTSISVWSECGTGQILSCHTKFDVLAECAFDYFHHWTTIGSSTGYIKIVFFYINFGIHLSLEYGYPHTSVFTHVGNKDKADPMPPRKFFSFIMTAQKKLLNIRSATYSTPRRRLLT